MQLKKIRSYMMPVSMFIGAVFYDYLSVLAVITPFLIFLMLLISYCNISLKEVKPSRLHIYLLLIQLLGSLAVYQLIAFFDPVVAQGAMVCVLAPTATSAIVITGMLGGNVVSLATYTLISNLSVVIFAPLFFVLIGYDKGVSFIHSLWVIFEKVFLLLLVPFALTLVFRRFLPGVFQQMKKKQSISFYLWNLALMIVTAKTIKFVLSQDSGSYYTEMLIAGASLIVCVSQFFFGRRLGRRFGDTVAAGQGLGQKNTILAIWMSLTYLNPMASIGPGSYVLWQNIVNSYQVWRQARNKS